jgi:uncharacterized SAM-binding protein YcdF (DUF218 family)
MTNPSDDVEAAASRVYAYLAETDPIGGGPYDAVIGFGMFDLGLPSFCGDLYVRGVARRIIFTGGIGAGTGDLGGPEADVWRGELARSHPSIPDAAVILENRSTNTGENVAFTAALLEREQPGLAFGRGLRRVVIVASPTRLRRVWLTIRRQQPALQLVRWLPDISLDADRALYAAQHLDHTAQLLGELDRIVAYAERGWTVPEPLPATIVDAREMLRARLNF